MTFWLLWLSLFWQTMSTWWHTPTQIIGKTSKGRRAVLALKNNPPKNVSNTTLLMLMASFCLYSSLWNSWYLWSTSLNVISVAVAPVGAGVGLQPGAASWLSLGPFILNLCILLSCLTIPSTQRRFNIRITLQFLFYSFANIIAVGTNIYHFTKGLRKCWFVFVVTSDFLL